MTATNSPAEPTSGTGSIRIALLAAGAIAVSLYLQFSGHTDLYRGVVAYHWPLVIALVGGGIPLVWQLARGMLRGEFGADLLAGISIVTSVLVDEPLAGVIVVLMLSGGEVLESYAVKRASSALELLARRMPQVASPRRRPDHGHPARQNPDR